MLNVGKILFMATRNIKGLGSGSMDWAISVCEKEGGFIRGSD